MKFLVLNDSHDKGKNPVNRLDNYHESILLKLDETLSIAKKKNCSFILHLGDIWDSSNVSWTIIDEWLDRIEKSKFHMYIVPGNHDMIGASWETSKSTALAHALKRCTYISLFDTLDDHVEGENNPYYIKSYPYYYNNEEDIKKNGLFHKEKNKFAIACTHSFISIKPFHPQVLHVMAKDIKCNYDLVLCSHFHMFFDETIKKTRFLNLGAFGRTSITQANHKPAVAIVDTETTNVEIIYLKSGKNGSDIFDLENKEKLVEFEGQLDSFISELKDLSVQSMDIRGIIENLGIQNNVDREIIDILINKVNKLEKENA